MPSQTEIAWLAGFLEGEGCLRRQQKIYEILELTGRDFSQETIKKRQSEAKLQNWADGLYANRRDYRGNKTYK